MINKLADSHKRQNRPFGSLAMVDKLADSHKSEKH